MANADGINLDTVEKKVGGKYKLVVAVAKRAEQLREGARQLVEAKSKNPISIALKEIAERDIVLERLQTKSTGGEGGDLADLFASMDDEGMEDLEEFIEDADELDDQSVASGTCEDEDDVEEEGKDGEEGE